MGELVLWCGMFAPKGRLECYHGLARGAPFPNPWICGRGLPRTHSGEYSLTSVASRTDLPLSPVRLCRNGGNAMFVILNEVKNLTRLIS